jgi:uncharacterized protein
MRIEWGPEKAVSNFKKHGIRFSDAEVALFDPHAMTREDENAEGEQRFISIGRDAVARVVVVVYTYRGENVRVISARKATRRERKAYEEGI